MAESKTAKFYHSAEKVYVWKETEVTTQRRRKVEVGTLLLGNDKKKNVLAEKVWSYF